MKLFINDIFTCLNTNKIIIPSILGIIVLVAGIFALMPINQASTVHTTIQGTQINEVANQVGTVCSTNLNDDRIDATSTADFLVMYQLTSTTSSATGEIFDGTNTLNLAMAVDTTAAGTLAYPGGTTVNFSDDDATDPADGCATVITEEGGVGSVTFE